MFVNTKSHLCFLSGRRGFNRTRPAKDEVVPIAAGDSDGPKICKWPAFTRGLLPQKPIITSVEQLNLLPRAGLTWIAITLKNLQST